MGDALAVDPGETCGWAWIKDGQVHDYGTLSEYDMLTAMRVGAARFDTCIIEEFRLYNGAQFTGSDCPVILLIGRMLEICDRNHWKVVMQPAKIKKPATQWARKQGIEIVGRTQHEKDAQMHAHWWLRRLALGGTRRVQSAATTTPGGNE